ncbi:MAG: 50S ribosomal protein L23 [Candidatus Porifericomitaceae bacterium WSBS_2022_MAG_OTU9]
MTDMKILNIIRGVVVSEKAEACRARGQYVFRVSAKANKPQIKRAVEEAFSTEVLSVTVSNVKSRSHKFRFIPGRISGWKKAYVRLKPGLAIDIEGKSA